MIRKDVNAYCKDFTKIENYSKAVLDTTQVWDVHHRLETHYLKNGKWISRDEELLTEQLIEEGVYFDRPPEELIFLTRSEHKKYHQLSMKKATEASLDVISKSVICIETGIVYRSTRDAESKVGIKHQNISRACKNKKTAGGYHWAYAPTEIED